MYEDIYINIGLACLINFVFSLNCNYKTSQFLVVNTFLYVLNLNGNNNRKYLRILTISSLIATIISYILSSLAQWISSVCVFSITILIDTLPPINCSCIPNITNAPTVWTNAPTVWTNAPTMRSLRVPHGSASYGSVSSIILFSYIFVIIVDLIR
jgi:hypothetical protein